MNSEWNNSEVSFYGEIEVQRHNKIGTFRVGWYVDTIVFKGPVWLLMRLAQWYLQKN